jgi:CBS domain-containing protein
VREVFPMKVESILRAKGSSVTTTTPDATIATIVRILKDKNIGALVVSEDSSTVLGLIAERDIVHGLCHYGARVLDLRVSDLMTRTVITCAPDDSLTRVMAQMTATASASCLSRRASSRASSALATW